jgi:hypothetical protein
MAFTGLPIPTEPFVDSEFYDPAIERKAAKFGVAKSAFSVSSGNYVLTGNDNAAELNAAIAAIVNEGGGTLDLDAGLYRVSADLTLPALTVADRWNFRMRGTGPSNFWAFRDGTPHSGTTIALDDGFQIRIPSGRVGTRFEDLTILGRSDGEPLILDLATATNPAFVVGGGFRSCVVINDHTDAPEADTWALRTPAVFLTGMIGSMFYGVVAPISRWQTTAIARADLWNGNGIHITGNGVGGQGNISDITVSGFETGFRVGYTVAAFPSGNGSIEHMVLERFQANYCDVGLELAKGSGVTFVNQGYFEQNNIASTWLHSDAPGMVVYGGRSVAPSRADGSTTHMLYGSHVLGDPTESEGGYGFADFRYHDFGINTQPAIFAFGAAGAKNKRVLIDACRARNNGGTLLSFDAATLSRGIPAVEITNIDAPSAGGNRLPRSLLVTVATRGAAYTQHTHVDGRYLVRVGPGCGVDNAGLDYSDGIEFTHLMPLDFSDRAMPPWKADINTAGGDFALTLGDMAVPGKPMILRKLSLTNEINVTIPSGTTITGTDQRALTGPTTLVLKAVGNYTFERVGDGAWTLGQPLAPSAGGTATATPTGAGNIFIDHGLGAKPTEMTFSVFDQPTFHMFPLDASTTDTTIAARVYNTSTDVVVSSGSVKFTWTARA